MNLEAVFRSMIKPELNAIYTEPPFMMENGWDCGWFCREHALHTYILAVLFRQRASIKTGDFVIHSQNGTGITSVNSGAGHAWCEIDETTPVDLSITFSHFRREFPYLPIVYGAKSSGAFDVRYFLSEEDFSSDPGAGSFAISYIERQSISPDVSELLAFPYHFLLPPPAGLRKWTDIHGPEIFNQTTAHLLRLAKKQLKPLCGSHSAKQIIKFIKSRYPNAMRDILSEFLAVDKRRRLN
jgi:hypothetical protein